MAWLSNVFPVRYYLMWLETCLHNHQDKVVPSRRTRRGYTAACVLSPLPFE